MILRVTVRFFVIAFFLGLLYQVGASAKVNKSKQRQILVFGGNGFIGASTVEKLLHRGDNVTIVNRGNWYWDSKERIKPHVNYINCDRKNKLSSCTELVQLTNSLGKDPGLNCKCDNCEYLVIEVCFEPKIHICKSSPTNSHGPDETKDSTALLKDKASLYVHLSTDTVYDVCDIQERQVPLKEDQVVRPTDAQRRELLNAHHSNGNRKLQAEEELIKQRNHTKGGIPYVIFRLPDVLGPRDTTYRFWIYQLWIRLAPKLPKKPVVIPKYLVDYKISLVYVDDVAKAIVEAIEPSNRDVVLDQVFNLAWPEILTLPELLHTIEAELGGEKQKFKTDDDSINIYFYPTGRTGPLDSSKAIKTLKWSPKPWKEAIAETVRFYDEVLTGEKFKTQRDEIIQIQAMQFYDDDKLQFYNTLEKEYKIDLSHFKPHDEL